MSIQVQLVDDKGRAQMVNICLSSLVGDTKKKLEDKKMQIGPVIQKF